MKLQPIGGSHPRQASLHHKTASPLVDGMDGTRPHNNVPTVGLSKLVQGSLQHVRKQLASLAIPSCRALARELVEHCEGYRQIMKRPALEAFLEIIKAEPPQHRAEFVRRAKHAITFLYPKDPVLALQTLRAVPHDQRQDVLRRAREMYARVFEVLPLAAAMPPEEHEAFLRSIETVRAGAPWGPEIRVPVLQAMARIPAHERQPLADLTLQFRDRIVSSGVAKLTDFCGHQNKDGTARIHAALVRVRPEQRQRLLDAAIMRLPEKGLGAQKCIQVLESLSQAM